MVTAQFAIKNPFEAYMYVGGRSIRLWSDTGHVLQLVEGLLIPMEAQHNFKTLQAYNEALVHAREVTAA